MSLNVDTMRLIDRIAGVPLCALVSPFVRLADYWRRKRHGNNDLLAAPRRVLFIELSEMGSAVLVDPAMRKTLANGAEIYFLIFKKNKPSLDLLKTVPDANIFTIDASSLTGLVKDTLRFLVQARRWQIDTVIDLELFSRFTALLSGLSGASKRVGYHIFHGEGLWRGSMLTHRVHYNPHQHIAKNFLALVHAAFAKAPEKPYSKVKIDDSEIKLAKAKIDLAKLSELSARITNLATRHDIAYVSQDNPLLLVNANASDLLVQRRWPPERFAKLVREMAQRWPNAVILLTGSPAEIGYVENVRKQANVSKALNFAGQVSFDELPPLYSLADVMVTNDSGPAHFAAVTNLKTVVLFGPETPALYGSLGPSIAITANLACSPCVSAANHRKTPCQDNVCMQAISVEDVMQAVACQLQTGSNET